MPTNQGVDQVLPEQPYRILALPGGGIHGMISAVWVTHLERAMGGPVADHVDLIAGTSTGAIIAAALAMGKPGEAIVDLYRQRGEDIFPGWRPRWWSRSKRFFSSGPSAPKYDGVGLGGVLRHELGEQTTLGDFRMPTLIPSYNTQMRDPLMFKSFKPEHQRLPAWEVVKASASAPTYFPAHVMEVDGEKVPLIDGGMVANNPTLCAIAEAIRLSHEADIDRGLRQLRVVTLDTGSLTRPISASNAQEWGPLEWARPISDVLMDASSDAVNYIAQRLLPDPQYVYMQTPLTDAHDAIDDTSEANLQGLVRTAERYVKSEAGSEKLQRAAELLRG